MLRETVLAEYEMTNRVRKLNSQARERAKIAEALKSQEPVREPFLLAALAWVRLAAAGLTGKPQATSKSSA